MRRTTLVGRSGQRPDVGKNGGVLERWQFEDWYTGALRLMTDFLSRDTNNLPPGAPSPEDSLPRDVLFPTLRGTVVEVIRMAADPDRSDEELFRVVAADPSLSLRVLRFANSAAFRLESEVTSVSRAVNVIGSRALRNIAICFAATDSTPADAVGQFAFAEFLEDCLRRGAAAELLAQVIGMPDPEEAFTAGLLQDFGVVALMMHDPAHANEWNAVRKESSAHRRELERALFGQAHDEIARELGQRWKLPETLSDAMVWHHAPEAAQGLPSAQLVAVCNMAEQLADIYICDDKQSALDAAHSRLEKEWGLKGEQIDRVVRQIPARVEIYADAMGINVAPQTSLDQVVEEIRAQNQLLVKMNLEYQQETWKLEELLREKEEAERELKLAQARLERLATTDPLTLLPNRRHFEVHLERELNRAQRSGAPMSVILGDVDFFKSLNDTYGHPFGDMVLRMVASALRAAVRSTDLIARIGGEEFLVALPDTTLEAARATAERLRRVVGERPVRLKDGGGVSVTISIGLALGGRGARGVEELIGLADTALLDSKAEGRNQVTICRSAA